MYTIVYKIVNYSADDCKESSNMKVKLIQVDGKLPNLTLMKISTYKKSKGNIVNFDISNPDEVWISCIFTWNKHKAFDYARKYLKIAKVRIGGSGVSLNITLPEEIEHIMPDYSLYNIDYSVGFTSRGCIRKCPFCIVPEKEGYIREHSPFNEFVHPSHKKILLLDNNFLASPKCKEKLEWLIEGKYRVSFNQGLDIRLINEELAKLLKEVKSRNLKFSDTRYYFAWDSLSYSKQVFKGIEALLNAGIKPQHLMFYVLVGFDTTFEEDLYRVHKLIEFGCYPFIMKYNNKREPRINALARWVNRRYHKVVSWHEYSGNKWKDNYDVERIVANYDRFFL